MEPECPACPRPDPLWPRNALAWRAFLLVADQVVPVVSGTPPLNLAAAIQILDYAGIAPDDPEDLLHKLKFIRRTWMEAQAKENG